MRQERILLGFDGAVSQGAVDWVVDPATRNPSYVTLVSNSGGSGGGVGEDRLRAAQRQLAVTPAVALTSVVVDQPLGRALVERSGSHDLLIVGSHPGYEALPVLVSSPPFQVASRSLCPSVIIPVRWEPTFGPIVVGVGDDQSAVRASLFAAREAVLRERELVVVHSWRMPAPSDPMAASIIGNREQLRWGHREILRDAVDRIRAAFPRVRLRAMLEEGPTGEQIATQSGHPELVVLGTHHHAALTEVLLGSTACDVMRSARAPLAIVPPENPAGL